MQSVNKFRARKPTHTYKQSSEDPPKSNKQSSSLVAKHLKNACNAADLVLYPSA